ncbi:MAG: hypothetical protein MAG581_00207 [Deltaproteobacteria bacterium]|jgi:hypothetical protein|nr:hypothetical protein [Deltaproteobacteria bacterium]
MISHIGRSLLACVLSACLHFFGLFKIKSLLAAEQLDERKKLNLDESPPEILDLFYQDQFFLKISPDTTLTITESLLVFAGIILLKFVLWVLQKPRVSTPSGPVFQLLNLGEHGLLIQLKSEVQTLELLSKIKTSKKYRLSANLNRVTLTPHLNTFLLEDKNYKNALLINRRRSHRMALCNDDILDVGEMILLYRNPNVSGNNIQRLDDGKLFLPSSSIKPKGPVQKGTPILTLIGSQQDFPLVRNLNTLGKSKSNDIIIESDEIALRHVKIYKVGETWKIQNLNINETTSVNGRRIDQRLLQDGDEVTVGDVSFKFSLSKAPIKQFRRPRVETAQKTRTT